MNTNNTGLLAIMGAAAFLGEASGVQVITNPNFDNDSGNPIVGDGGERTISGWGEIHLYNHSYDGTDGVNLSAVGNQNYGLNDDIELGDTSLTDTHKGVDLGVSQTVDLTSVLSAPVLAGIANNEGEFAFSAWMASFKNDANDVPRVRLQFFASTDGSGTAIGEYNLDRGTTTNQVTTAEAIVNGVGADPNASTDADFWALYEIQTTVPTLAQSLRVEILESTAQPGISGFSDLYVDQIVVDVVPEPRSALLFLGGIFGLLLKRKRN